MKFFAQTVDITLLSANMKAQQVAEVLELP